MEFGYIAKMYFEHFENIRTFWICWKCVFYFGCVLSYKLLFSMRLSDSVSFSVYMNMFKKYACTFFEKCPEV